MTFSKNISLVVGIGWISAAAAAKLIEDPYLNAGISTAMMFRAGHELLKLLPDCEKVMQGRTCTQLGVGMAIAGAGSALGQVFAEKVDEVLFLAGLVSGVALASWVTYSEAQSSEQEPSSSV